MEKEDEDNEEEKDGYIYVLQFLLHNRLVN